MKHQTLLKNTSALKSVIYDNNPAAKLNTYREFINVSKQCLIGRKSDKSSYAMYHQLAKAYSEIGDHINALSHFRKSINLKPDFADNYIDLSAMYIKLRMYKKAEERLEQGLEKATRTVKLLDAAGTFFNDFKQEPLKALLYFEEAIKVESQLARLHNNKAMALIALKNYDKAIVSLTVAIKLDAEFLDAYRNLAIAHYRLSC